MNSKEFIQELNEGKLLVAKNSKCTTIRLIAKETISYDDDERGLHMIVNVAEWDVTSDLIFFRKDDGSKFGLPIGFVNAEKWEVFE